MQGSLSATGTTLVAGASGFIGKPALAHLLAAGHDVHAVSTRAQPAIEGVRWHRADLLEPGTAEKLIASVQPQRFLHLAWYAEPGRFWDSPENVRWVEATLRLLRAFASAGGRRAVLAGTCAEYDWSVGGVCSEEETPLRPDTAYGVSKDATRRVAAAFAELAGLELAWGRIFFLYGPREPPQRLLPLVTRALLAGERAKVTAGTQVRDFMHVDDVARAFVAVLESELQGAVNIASGEGVELRKLVELVGAAAGRPELIEFGAIPPRPGEPDVLVADVRRLRDIVGFHPRHSLPDGVRETVAWWRSQ
ncbi:MAG TPA: NAD(P)-dependent oxidoreductase [Solirubrobacteraceae bacterium]|jgi:nucleoside-diphosphate-sugar epimerase|nr:NAD(P)-dependent oxidoreductase [Solirubrobacteraceae bacterium]